MSDFRLPEQTSLTAGPFTLTFEHGDLRWIRLGPREVIRRVYGAVRDHQWRTVPATISDLTVDARGDSFTIGYTAHHEHLFHWRAGITGDAHGTIQFAFAGEATNDFQRNRIGLCLLHPLRECIGARLRLRRGGEAHWIDGPGFPDLVAREQPIAGFTDLTGLSHEMEPGVWAECTFEGERFETEDQRNWIDASFKTYGTPLSLPMPVSIVAGTTIVQRLTLRLRRDGEAEGRGPVAGVGTWSDADRRSRSESVRIDLDGGTLLPLPAIGVCLDERNPPLTVDEIASLRAMRLAHVRIDVRFAEGTEHDGAATAQAGRDEWRQRLDSALETARAIGCRAELVLHLHDADGGVPAPLDRLFDALTPAAIARLIVFVVGRRTTTHGALAVVRAHLQTLGAAWATVPVATGSAQDLYQFHLDDPPIADAICWSMHPQAHAVDVSSIAETPAAIADQVRSVKARHPGVAVAISPVMFSPADVDARLHSPFAGAWTLAVLKHLVESGTESATFFAASGPRGLMEHGTVFPLYHSLKDLSTLAAQSGARAIATASSDEAIASLLIRAGAPSSSSSPVSSAPWLAPAVMFLANLSRHPRRVSLPTVFRSAADAGDGGADAPVFVPPFGQVRVDGFLRSSL